ncbi:uncharacterized protein LOC117781925 [Drosophila innubila]|uniref:uncharacterized protein LOC117781925 n=1 Tax=Drosophila innubila TaxID=198719 RepID=UPI00148DDE80|nr:uncharacterized protein LOC117781925 [Drosophila innubila]
MANINQRLQSSNSASTSDRLRNKRRLQMYLKLIDLYSQHECLWMENHKDFFNFALKENLWEEIANQMISPLNPIPNVDKWKRLIHILRYRVQFEQVHQQEAKFYNQVDELPRKLCYSDKFHFLFKHMFDRKDQSLQPSTATMPLDKSEEQPQESLAAKCMRMGREKSKTRVSFSHKLKAMESLRNRRRSTLLLTPEAFENLKSTGKKRST